MDPTPTAVRIVYENKQKLLFDVYAASKLTMAEAVFANLKKSPPDLLITCESHTIKCHKLIVVSASESIKVIK